MSPYLSVIIPAYNEERRIGKTLIDIDHYLRNQKYWYEIIVVDDGSRDRTKEVVEKLYGKIRNLSILEYGRNSGKGFAVREGMRRSKGQFKLFMDADNSSSIENLDQFLPYFKQGFDIVISSRRRPESRISVKQPLYRQILGSMWRGITKIIVPLSVKDSQNGFKVFKREAANFLFSKQTIWGWAFDVEILALAEKYHFKIKEAGIEWKNDERSTLSIGGMQRMLGDLFKIRMNLWKKRYD